MRDAPGAFLAAFGEAAVYTAGAISVELSAVVEDTDGWQGMPAPLRTTVGQGQTRLGKAWLVPADIPGTPAFGHVLEQGGRTWLVMDWWPEGDMLVLGLAVDVFVVDVVASRISEVSDGALGTRPVPVEVWSGRAAVHGLGGVERIAAARQVGVGYRHGWMPACPVQPGDVMATPTERLHVTSAATDVLRGWTLFEAEVRQEDQA